MLNFYITAVKYGILSIEKVPQTYQIEVKSALGIEDVEIAGEEYTA
ncbi:hypothetical protein P4V34_28535 [Bacillus thuringiensis]|nr:hypothetical protein [Bacillus thuringiensis]